MIGAIGVAAAATGAALVSMSREALEQREVFRRLEDSLQRAGIAYGDVSDEIARFAAERQRMTRFGDDQTAAVMSRVAQLTQSLQPSMRQLQEMTVLTQDVAEATGRDSSRIAEYVARAFAGTTEGLDRLIPAHREYLQEINKIEDAHERAALVTQLLREEFDGVSEAIPETTLAVSRLQNGLGDLREALGNAALEGQEASGALTNTADAVDYLAAALDPASESTNALSEAVQAMAASSGQAIIGLARLVVQTFVDLRMESLRLEGALESGRLESAQADIRAIDAILEGGGGRAGQVARGAIAAVPLAALADEGISAMQGTSSNLEIAGMAASASREELLQRRAEAAAMVEVSQRAREQSQQALAALGASYEEFDDLLQRGADDSAVFDDPQIFRPGFDRGGEGVPRALRPSVSDDDSGGSRSRSEAIDLELQKAAEARDAYDGLSTKLGVVENTTALLAETVRELSGAFDGMASSGVMAYEGIVQATERTQIKLGEYKQAQRDAAFAQGEALKQTADSLDRIRTGALANFVEASAEGFGRMALEGGNAGEMLAKASLKSIGQMASAMGRMFVLSGIAGQAIPFLGMKLTGPVAIAAGAKLIALGGLLGAGANKVGGGGGGRGGGGGPTGVGESFENTISRPSLTRQDFAGMTVITEDERTVNRLTRMTDRSREIGVTRNAL